MSTPEDINSCLTADPQKLNDEELELVYKQLLKEEEQLDKSIKVMEESCKGTDLGPQMEALHRYNDMKDAAQLVIGYLANSEQTSIKELHERYNLPVD